MEELAVELPEPGILETGVAVNLEEEYIKPLDTAHFSTLAETLDKKELTKIASDLIEK